MEEDIKLKEMAFHALINEYNVMKTESMAKLQFEINIISLYITAVGIVLSTLKSDLEEISTLFNTENMFCLVLPCVTICISIIWLDQVYRQIKIAFYLSKLESKINKFFGMNSCDFNSSILCWEHWLRSDDVNRGKYNVSRFFYYICLGIFVVVPIFSYLFGLDAVDYNIYRVLVPTLISGGGYLVYICFGFFYIFNILKLNREVNSQN